MRNQMSRAFCVIVVLGVFAAISLSVDSGEAQRKGAARVPEYRAVDISMYPEGDTPVIVRRRGATVSLVPLPVINSSGDPGDPIIPQPSNLRTAVLQATKAVTDPKKEDNAVGIALGYSIVSSRVGGGSVTIAQAQKEIKALTDKFLEKQGATDNWKAWRQSVGAALGAEQQAGRLKTKDQVAKAFTTIAEALVAEQKVARAQLKGRFLKILRVVLTILPEILDGGDFNILDLVEILSGLLKKG